MLVGIDDAIQYSTHKEYVKVEVDENIQNKIDAHSFLLNNNIKTLEEFNNRFNCLINKMNLIKNSINDIDDLICQVENQIQITSSNHQLLHDLDKLKQKKETKLILLRNTKIDYRNFVKTQEVIQSLQNHQYTRKLNHKLEYEDDLNLRIEEARSFSPNQLHKENETRFCPSEIEI